MTQKIVLVSTLPIRQKYMGALGSVDAAIRLFDEFIVLASGDPQVYDDELSEIECIRVQGVQDMADRLADIDPDVIVLFNSSSGDRLYPLVKACLAITPRTAILENKATLRSPKSLLFPGMLLLRYRWGQSLLRWLYSRRSGMEVPYRTQLPECDLLLANAWPNAARALPVLEAKRVRRVRHLDAVPPIKQSVASRGISSIRSAVFLDQDLPNHAEALSKGLSPHITDRNRYFSDLSGFLDCILGLLRLDDVIVARHPNCSGEIVERLPGVTMSIGKTRDSVEAASVVMSHYSNSIGFAVQMKKKTILVKFPLSMSSDTLSLVDRRAAMSGLDIYSFADGKLEVQRGNRFSRMRSRLLAQQYSRSSPSAVDYLLDTYRQ